MRTKSCNRNVKWINCGATLLPRWCINYTSTLEVLLCATANDYADFLTPRSKFFFLCVSFHLTFVCFCNNNALQCRNNRIKKTEPKLVLKRFIQLVQSKRRNFLLYTTENMLPNDNVSMSVGHLDHVFFVYSSMEHVTWKSPGAMSHSATLGTRWFPGHVFHRAVNNQDVIKMSDGHRNVR